MRSLRLCRVVRALWGGSFKGTPGKAVVRDLGFRGFRVSGVKV